MSNEPETTNTRPTQAEIDRLRCRVIEIREAVADMRREMEENK